MLQERKIALIPAYEPTGTLPELVRQLYRAGFQPIVIDDGSGEAYRGIFVEVSHYAFVLTQEVNKGKGCALKTGLAYINERYPSNSVIVTLDADGQHSVEDAVRVCNTAAWNMGTLVLGCRGFDQEVPARSRFGNTVTRFIYRIATGVNVSDTQTGLRAFGMELVPFLLSVSGDRYEYEMNVLLESSRQNVPMREVGIQTIYLDNNSSSHFSTIKDSFRVYREIIKFASSSLIGFVVDYGLYSMLAFMTAGLGAVVSIPLSNVTARIVSATVNFSINKKLVFKSSSSTTKSAVQYFILAACILVGNTVLLSFLVNSLGFNKYASKIFTEITFFAASWLVQKFIIFGKRDAKGSKHHTCNE
ncbi:hypothetical protein SDC9_47616 [bioreactor metagenome]|uniref:Glycosyltransferase 2-like domain-containing protein n=1 Tax=bioreactor metagenome TaxID=1076179 RepID=A0A644WC22_9ZZZZ